MKISFKPKFIKRFKKLPTALQEEIMEKVKLLKNEPRHPFLKTHKLKGELDESYTFSVNYSYRIVFEYLSKNEVVLLCVGNHDIYK